MPTPRVPPSVEMFITMLLLPGRPSACGNSSPAPKLGLKTTCSLQTSLILPLLAETLWPFITSTLVPCESTSVSCSVVSNSLWPHGLNSPGQNTGVGSLFLLQVIFPTQGSNPGLLHCRWILLPAESQGKPKNTGVGRLSLLQGIFPTQESNWGLLHCRLILSQLNYQGSQIECMWFSVPTLDLSH